MDSHDYLTISALSYAYQKKQGALDNVELFSGVLKRYFQQFVIGGRTMCGYNCSSYHLGKMVDFDGVSLYPSAMFRLYYPTGKPKLMTAAMID